VSFVWCLTQRLKFDMFRLVDKNLLMKYETAKFAFALKREPNYRLCTLYLVIGHRNALHGRVVRV